MRRSRWLIAYLPPVLIVLAAVAFSVQSYAGFLLFLAAPIILFVGLVIASLAVVRLRCWHCGERFLSITYPLWPFQNWCAHCSTRTDEP